MPDSSDVELVINLMRRVCVISATSAAALLLVPTGAALPSASTPTATPTANAAVGAVPVVVRPVGIAGSALTDSAFTDSAFTGSAFTGSGLTGAEPSPVDQVVTGNTATSKPKSTNKSTTKSTNKATKKSTKKPAKKATSKVNAPKKKPRKTKKAPKTGPVTSTPTVAPSTVEARIIALTNEQRTANGCGALRTDAALTAAARAHSADMVKNGYFGHTGADGADFTTRASRTGYASASAENIAWGYRDAATVVTGWLNSAGHRANILNCASVAVGVGIAAKADGTPYYTQIFGRV